jgi:hypothetical protein
MSRETEAKAMLAFVAPETVVHAVEKAARDDYTSKSDIVRGAVIRDLRARGLLSEAS